MKNKPMTEGQEVKLLIEKQHVRPWSTTNRCPVESALLDLPSVKEVRVDVSYGDDDDREDWAQEAEPGEPVIRAEVILRDDTVVWMDESGTAGAELVRDYDQFKELTDRVPLNVTMVVQ